MTIWNSTIYAHSWEKGGVVVAEIRPLAPTLEDVFVELTYKHQAQAEAARG